MEAEVGMKGPEGRYCMFMLTPPQPPVWPLLLLYLD